MTAEQRVRAPRRWSARRVAFEVLRAVREDEAYANLALPARLERAGLSAEDAGFATELTYGTVRLSGYYDRVIELAARRTIAQIHPAVVDVLRLGAHQLLALETPAHAGVNESVALVREMGQPRAAGFANAVLRRMTERSAEEWRAAVAAAAPTPVAAEAWVAAHPEWIVAALRDALAAEGASDELAALLEADNASPAVNFMVPSSSDLDRTQLTPNRYSPLGYRGVPRAAVGGPIRVQDEGSQLAALALVAARPPVASERWLDMCAGPGGKSVVLAGAAAPAGVELIANEVSPARAQLVVRGLRDAGFPDVEVRTGDGRAFASGTQRFDRILLDAPCTGLGALRRRPEARWRKQPSDLNELTRLQSELLDAAVAALEPGGVLAYVTCSPHLAETSEQIDGVLARHPEMRALPTQPVLDGITRELLPESTRELAVQLWPHRHGTDAMFIQLLTKVEA